MYTTGFMQCCCLGEVAFRGNNPYSSNSWLLFYSNITHENSQSSSDREFAPASPRVLFLIRFPYWGLHNNFLFVLCCLGFFFLPKHKHPQRKKKSRGRTEHQGEQQAANWNIPDNKLWNGVWHCWSCTQHTGEIQLHLGTRYIHPAEKMDFGNQDREQWGDLILLQSGK